MFKKLLKYVVGIVSFASAVVGLLWYFGYRPTLSKQQTDPDEAYYTNVDELRRLAEAGDPRAQNFLGATLANNAKDKISARKWYYRAAVQGNPKAQLNLGMMYEKGEGGPQDYEKALEWLLKAAEQGNAEAQYEAAGIYVNGSGSVHVDYRAALRLDSQAAEQGYVQAYPELGLTK